MDHDFVPSDDPKFGILIGGSCAHRDVSQVVCGYPRQSHNTDVKRADVATGIRKWLDDIHSALVKDPQIYVTRAQVNLLNDLRAQVLDCHRAGHFPWEPKP